MLIFKTKMWITAAAAVVFLCTCGFEGAGTGDPFATGREDILTVSETEDQPVKAINAWGDSITQGYGSSGLSYPQYLEQLTGIRVRNFGISGQDSREIMARAIDYGSQKEEVLVIQMGDNDGWRTLDELIMQYMQIIEKAGTDRYIIISSTDDPDDKKQIWGSRFYSYSPGLSDTEYEAQFRKAFGDHLLVGRTYLLENGLEANDLKETEEDRERAQRGLISLQLRNPTVDNTHLNEYGYKALALGVYEKGMELGYWGEANSESAK